MKLYHFLMALLLCGVLVACDKAEEQGEGGGETGAQPTANAEAQAFIDSYTEEYLKLSYAASEAAWKANTEIIEGDTNNAYQEQVVNEAYAAFTGSEENIENARKFLAMEDISPIQKKQLDNILYSAADNPATVPDLVKARIKAETEQTQTLFGFDFQIRGKSVTTNDIDGILKDEDNLKKRLEAWEASKEVGKELKEGLVNLRDLRNQTVQALGYKDYFSYQVSDYGMETPEMMDLMRQMVADIWPLFRELHTYARYELADRYGAEVPEYLPAHWVPNRWGQDWQAIEGDGGGVDLNAAIEEKGPEWLVKTAEDFYVSVGFEKLPASFYEKSSLYPLPPDADFKKNNHASAWHMDLKRDVRSLMSVEPNTEWYETTHHELGHIYYYLEYTNPDVPPLLRGGANRGFHEAMGSLLGLASLQQPYLEHLGLWPNNVRVDMRAILLKEALNYIVFIPFGAGVMPEFEHDLYAANLSPEEFNARWWDLKKKYQGIVPPSERGSEYCDAASKTHINNDAAQYYDYAISYILLFQFHDHIAKKILNMDPQSTNYADNLEVGNFLKSLMRPGATQDWRELMQETLGSGMSAAPMLEYFDLLTDYIKGLNEGRVHTLPDTFPGVKENS